jgi:DNA repair exonuclease SbcCD ATPase subunit
MRLRRIELPGFGCLRDFNAEFSPGLNLVYGLNEAGKSTLQQAVGAMLYGFFDNDRVRAEETARHERFRPWPGDGSALAPPYRGVLEYEMEFGDALEVRRDFSTTDVPTQLIDLVTGTDLAPGFGLGRHGNVPFARKQLGMSRAVFQSCAFIAQGELLGVSSGASPQEIGDAIAAMADSARRDVSAAAAVDSLDKEVRRIGRDSARTAELPKARESLRLAHEELAAHDGLRHSTSEKAVRLQTAHQRLLDLRMEEAALQALVLRAKERALSVRLDALAEAEVALEEGIAERQAVVTFKDFPVQHRDRVVTLADRKDQGEREITRLLASARLLREQVDDTARLEFEALRVSVGALSEEAIAEAQAAAYAMPEPPPPPMPIYRRVLAGIRRLVRTAVRFVLRRSVPEAMEGEPAPPLITRDEALALLERHRRYLILRPVVDDLEKAEAELRAETVQLDATESELAGLLEGIGSVGAFVEGCRQQSRYAAAVAAIERSEKRCDDLLQGRTRQDLESEREENELRLTALRNEPLERSSSKTPADPERALRGLQEERQRLEVETARLDEEVSSVWREQRPRAEIEEEIERWTRDVSRLETRRAAALLARDVIGEAMAAVYRDFAPAVSTFLCEGFEQVTDGKYTRAHVDPATLRVSLLLPETGQEISDPPVSRGTRALAYVLMRMGLAQHMSAVAEPVPLVLDDPFVDFDSHRLRRMLEFLAGISDRMQVLLFSKDPAVLRWFEERANDERNRVLMLDRRALTSILV